jgi:hypothetical protein
MAIDFFEGTITETPQPLLSRVLKIQDMDVCSSAYIGAVAAWLDLETVPHTDTREIAYADNDISEEACHEDWLRIIRLPKGFIIDASHLEQFDEAGKLTEPLNTYAELPYDGAQPEVAIGYIKNKMQLKGFEDIVKQMFNYVLEPSILQEMRDAIESKNPEDEDPRDFG